MYSLIVGDLSGSKFTLQSQYNIYYDIFDQNSFFTYNSIAALTTMEILNNIQAEQIMPHYYAKKLKEAILSYKKKCIPTPILNWAAALTTEIPYLHNEDLPKILPLINYYADKKEQYKDTDLLLSIEKILKLTSSNLTQQPILFELLNTLILLKIKYYESKKSINPIDREVLAKNFLAPLFAKYNSGDKTSQYLHNNFNNYDTSTEYTIRCALHVTLHTIESEQAHTENLDKLTYGIKKATSLGGDTTSTSALTGLILSIIYGDNESYKELITPFFTQFDKPLYQSLTKYINTFNKTA